MTAQEEFIHNFRGYWNYPSRCHIRILDDKDKPLVIVCSQMANDPGTSVTNAAEIIAKQVQDYLSRDNLTLTAAINRYVKKSKLTKILDDLVFRLKESKNMTVFTLESIKLALEYREKQLDRTGKINNFIWVEHYSKAIGFFPEDRYAIVSFDPDSWSPSWRHLLVERLSIETGYDVEDFEIPGAIIIS